MTNSTAFQASICFDVTPPWWAEAQRSDPARVGRVIIALLKMGRTPEVFPESLYIELSDDDGFDADLPGVADRISVALQEIGPTPLPPPALAVHRISPGLISCEALRSVAEPMPLIAHMLYTGMVKLKKDLEADTSDVVPIALQEGATVRFSVDLVGVK